MNPLFNHIPAQSLRGTFEIVKHLLQGSDQLIFESMAIITKGSRAPFAVPTGAAEFDKKYAEIERLFGYRFTLDGTERTMRLLEEIYRQVTQSPLVGVTPEAILNAIVFATNRGFTIRLTEEVHWAAEWSVEIKTSRMEDSSPIKVHIHKTEWGMIVPTHIVEYLDSAIQAYARGMHAASVALLSIVVEATLRDVLSTRDYTFTPGASAVDVYEYSKALVDADIANNLYSVSFPGVMPLAPSNLSTSTAGVLPLEVEIRRKYDGKRNRWDLIVKDAEPLLGHWSSANIVQKAQKVIGGLGTALDIARNKEAIITSTDLPPDFDPVIQVVRNNLIHLSKDALDTHLPDYDKHNTRGHFTLEDFLNSSEMVYDLMTNVPRFVDEQYLRLRQGGFLF